MDRQTHSWLSPRSTWLGFVLSCALLAIALAPAALVIAAIAGGEISRAVLISATVAAGVCWLAAVLGLACTLLGNAFRAPVPGLFGGMLFRMGLPLMALIAIPQLGGAPIGAGLTATILGVYLLSLALETALAVRLISPLARPIASRVARAT